MKIKYTKKIVPVAILVLAGLVLYSLSTGGSAEANSSVGQPSGFPSGVDLACDIFLHIDGIKGESMDAAHNEWIEALLFASEATQPTGGALARQGARTGAKVEFSDLTIGKVIDKATPYLYLHCCTGKHIPNVEIEFCQAGGEKQVFFRIKLKDVIISSVRHTVDANTQTQLELVSFHFGRIEWEYTPFDTRGKPGASVKTFWDLVTNKGG